MTRRAAPTVVSREIFTDPEIFELEMKHIFEGSWVYLAHESTGPEQERLFHDLHGPSADLHRARQITRSMPSSMPAVIVVR